MKIWNQTSISDFHEGRHFELHEFFGAHRVGGSNGGSTVFRVWAPGVQQVSVVGDFNGWDTQSNPMTRLDGSDVWRVSVPKVKIGQCYKYRLQTNDGTWIEKSDPFAIQGEVAPNTASMVQSRSYRWSDRKWMNTRQQVNPWQQAMSIYEVHLGSWGHQANGDEPLYRAIAKPLAKYVRDLGFTHVELMPIMEHPYYPSWGYQVTGYFAATARYGGVNDLKYLVDTLHKAGIGVIFDWVPAHFPTDAHGLYKFNGESIFEHPDPRRGWHPDWTTAIFDFGKPEVRSFLFSSAMYWIEHFHADGLRVDAVASMLYLDYSRKDGEWLPNAEGGRENWDAVSLFRDLNTHVGQNHPNVMMIAEDSTAWPGVSRSADSGGLGFGFKWDLGWMNDTLRYFSKDPVYRKHHHNDLTFRAVYAHSENFVLPLSHDEVVHGKGSLLNKMPGDQWQKFANLRLLLASMYGQPGKKLLFMGSELASEQEWNCDVPLPWHLLESHHNKGIQSLVRALNHLYQSQSGLHELDHDSDGYHWIDGSDDQQSVISYARRGGQENDWVLIVGNYTPTPRGGYRIGVPTEGTWQVLLNTDASEFGGSAAGTATTVQSESVECHGRAHSIVLDLPPLGMIFLGLEAQ
jgi:1,4-alpha-glucan branching enzyme